MTPAELLREDAEARRRALDVARSVIVQAPAGSGKTELLTQRFLALLEVVDKPEAVLAITFTLKAAAEMRERILDALRRCEDSDADLLDTTRTLARAVIKVDVERQWGLLRNPSRLRVLTIDALNQSLARRLPVLSGLGAGLGVDEDGTRLYTQAAERLLTHLATGDARSADAVATVLEHLDNNVAELVNLTTAMLARREAWLPVLPADVAAYGDEGAVREELEAGRRDIVEAHLAQVRNAFPSDLLVELSAHAHESGRILRQLGRPSHICACRPGIPSSDAESLSHWQGLTQFLLTGEGQPRKQFNRTVGVLAKDDSRPEIAERKARVEESAREFAQHDRLHTLLAMVRDLPPAQYRDDEWRVLRALLLVLRLAAAELKFVFAERRAADHPEFAAAARQALGSDEEPTDTALALDVRLRHILVDEFQDTSEAQVRLLERLTAGWERGDGRTLFLVGDPMQSIYRFRNAEVGLFLDVRDHGLAELRLDPVTLRVNFRSTRPVVEWVNRSFVDVLPGHDDVLRGAVRFAESVAAPNATDDGGVHVHAFLRSSRRLEAQTVADIVERRLSESADARIGILVQGRGHLVEIVQELVQRRIAFEATDIDPLGARPAVLDVLSLTRALAHPGDRAAWIGVLRAPWCGLRLADLHALLADERDAAVLRLLEDPARVARLEPAARARAEFCRAVLVQALDERRRLGLRDTVARAWHALGGPATLARDRDLEEVQAYFDALGNVERESPGASVDLARLAEALQKLYAPARPSPETRVELMTIHKSKGLQFDTVVVPGLDRITQKDTPPLLRWLKLPGQGGHRLIIAPIAETGSETRNPLHTWLGRVEQEKLLQERRRLLYVAATRAERSLHLLGTCAVDTDETTGQRSVRAPDQESALGLLWAVPEIAGAFEARLADIDAIAGEQNTPIPRDPILLRLPDGWRPPAPPAAPPIVVREVRRRIDDTALEFDWASETARHVGTVVHRELQRLAHGTVDAVDLASIRTALEARYVVELAELGVPQERRATAASRAFTAIQRTLADERGRWLLGTPHRDAESELALSGRVGPDIVSIVIDRTFVDATGTRWIIDYKTSTHEGAGRDAFLDNERERYRPQLERYAELVGALGNEPIRLGLYFPLMSAWREWEPGDAAGGVALKSP
jgi:ATP-dependent exoDNAse (exonuclease V) beta subunit